MTKVGMGRRGFLAALVGSCLIPRQVACMGQSGAFSARRLVTGRQRQAIDRDSGLAKWAWELVRRTSAPARLEQVRVAADSEELLAEPFVYWCGQDDPGQLSVSERRNLDAFLRLGGTLVVDDWRSEQGPFMAGARREVRRIFPESVPVAIEPNNVIFKTFYLLKRPVGRIYGPERPEAIVRGQLAQVVFLSCDLLGALATRSDGSFLFEVESRAKQQREMAVRFAVNLAMYVLCSDYKDDQVHAEWLMRHRSRWGR